MRNEEREHVYDEGFVGLCLVHIPDLIFILLFYMMPVCTLNRALLRAKK